MYHATCFISYYIFNLSKTKTKTTSMRNFLLSLFLLCVAQYSFAQCSSCTPNNTGCKPIGGLCNKPDTGMANHPYSTVIHFNLPKKLTDPATLSQCSGCSYVQLNRVKITSLTGLPSGADNYNFSKSQSPYKGYYDVQNNDTLGCVTICGTPLAAGIYTIQVNIDADVVAIGTPIGNVSQNDVPQKYSDTIVILPDTSGSVSSFTYGGVREDCDSVVLNLNAILSAASPNPTRYFWDLGNGQTSNLKSPGLVKFSLPGTYKVALKTVYYNYYISQMHINNMTNAGSCWRGDVEELATGDPEVYTKVGLLGVNTRGNSVSSTSNFNIPIPLAQAALPIGTTAFSFELWDEDNGPPFGSADDNMGTYNININPFPFLPYDVNFNGSCAQGYVRLDTTVATVIVDTLVVTIKGRPTKPFAFASKDSLCNGDSVRLVATPYCADCTYEWYKNDSVYLVGATDSFYYAKVSGGYKIKVTNTLTGCTNLSDSAKRVYFGATPTVAPTVAYYSPTGQVFLNPGISSSFRAKWFKDGLEISGQTGSTIPFVGDGDYQVLIYNPNFPFCNVTTDLTTISTVGIEDDNSLLQGLSVHPNPSTGKFTLTLQTLATQVNLSVNDMVGRTVYSSTLAIQNNVAEKTIDLNESAKGVYMLNIEIAGKRVVRKLVVE